VKVETIGEQLLFTTVRIETNIGTGTGFIFSYDWNGKRADFLVTNRHVVENTTYGRFFFNLSDGVNPIVGKRHDIEIKDFSRGWHGHSDPTIDVTILPFSPILNQIHGEGINIYFRSISHTLVPTPEQLEQLDAIEDIIFVGYPNGIFDSKNLLPVVRKGITATSPQIDYEGKPILLVDASVFPGSSGSPVFVYNPGMFSRRGTTVVGRRILFLGVIAQVVIREEHGKIEFITIPTAQIPIVKMQQMIDLGIVYKSSTVLDTVMEFLKINGML
jgi:hypothetical protein